MRQWLWRVSVIGLVLGGAPGAWATAYAIDQDHTTIAFKIRHLFSKVEGTFNEFEGTFDYVPGHPELWKVSATIQTASIDTRVEQRDSHLRSKDFFDVTQYPTMTFTSTEVVEYTPASRAVLRGILSLHGVEQPVQLVLTIYGEGKDPWGNQRSGFTATATINRKDFGLAWNQTLETGQLLVGEEVEVTLEVEGIVKPKEAPASSSGAGGGA